jgi:hypothetical protein
LAALASTKADLPFLPEYKNLLLAAQKQLLELPLIFQYIIISVAENQFWKRIWRKMLERFALPAQI